MKNETIFLAFSFLENFCQYQKIPQNQYQLFGVTCLYIASKFEEIHPPKLKDFVYICDKAYTSKQIIYAELEICNCLDFKLIISTPQTFLNLFQTFCSFSKEENLTSRELLIKALDNTLFFTFDPFKLALISIYLIFIMNGKQKEFNEFKKTMEIPEIDSKEFKEICLLLISSNPKLFKRKKASLKNN